MRDCLASPDHSALISRSSRSTSPPYPRSPAPRSPHESEQSLRDAASTERRSGSNRAAAGGGGRGLATWPVTPVPTVFDSEYFDHPHGIIGVCLHESPEWA